MKSIISLHKKLIVMFILLALAILGIGYYYLYGMTTITGNLNINKISMVNKLYSYNVYSDFYFRATKYDENGKKIFEYSELQPLKTSIGYDLSKKNADLTLRSNENGKKIILTDDDGTNLERDIDIFNSFEKVFGDIVATQDGKYIEKSFKHTKETLKSLYGKEQDIKTKKASDLYTKIDNLPIANMRVKYFKLDAINKNLKGKMIVALKDKWQPNILEWNFGENDKIYLQYLTKWKNTDLDKYVKNMSKKNKIVTRLVKINNNKLQKMYLLRKDMENKIKTLFMDENGYVYTLIFKATNPKSFEKYMSDYLKIAYGIYFVDMPDFKNWFADKQKGIDDFVPKNNNDIVYGLTGTLVCNKYLNKKLGNELLKHFKIPLDNYKIYSLNGKDLICLSFDEKKEYPISTAKVDYAEYFKKYDEMFPKEKMIKELEKNLKHRQLLSEAVDKLDGWWTNGKDKLKELCPNGKIECVQQLKNNNWEY